MRILYAALLFMMMLVGAPAALAAPQISVGLVTGQLQTAALMPTGRSLATLCCALRQTA